VDPACTHEERTEGKCPACGSCEHDLVLNAACYYCGETDLKLTIKPAQDELVTLRRPKRPSDP
jgi:hypothetical protein